MVSFRPRPLYYGKRACDTYWIGDWASLDAVQKRENPCPCRELNLDSSVCSPSSSPFTNGATEIQFYKNQVCSRKHPQQGLAWPERNVLSSSQYWGVSHNFELCVSHLPLRPGTVPKSDTKMQTTVEPEVRVSILWRFLLKTWNTLKANVN
jgi:hypothetical protein